ncbi:serine/threonine protein kinase [Gracilibacillus oryzae]|uniref:Serine/threonine protein kinase n=1 Tax=Gracilibacillus oryzae TaxID=1672701 RepID=A0A7C8KNV2_9BACI|nr:serine/threonine protein kinase [Gracilibacillus oryzae]KAB8129335.1 serine/threonine protein kinase [Gracilibacillus oryzae]
MSEKWQEAERYINNINVIASSNNDPVTIHGNTDHVKCIGIGTDAAVFQLVKLPKYAFKIYAKNKTHKIEQEAEIYQLIGDSQYFTNCFGYTDQWLVLQYEEGITLYDCLLRGIKIPEQVIKDVDSAREYARSRGLNPRDIHLKNILLQDGRAKIFDVSEYLEEGNDYRWEHLKKAYYGYYYLIEGKSVPHFLVETVRKWYNQQKVNQENIDEFIKSTSKLIKFWQ